MTDEPIQNLGKLATAFDRAETSITRTGQAFGELANQSQLWTTISRILSGTGAWRVQNQIRAIGNVVNMYHKNQAEANKTILETIDANEKLAESYAYLKEQMAMTDEEKMNTPMAIMFEQAEKGKGLEKYNFMFGKALSRVKMAQRGLVKAMRPGLMSRMAKGELSTMGMLGEVFDPITKRLAPVGFSNTLAGRIAGSGIDKFRQSRFGQGVIGRGSSALTNIRNRLAPVGFENTGISRGLDYMKGSKAGKAIGKITTALAPIATKIKAFFLVGAAVLGKFLVYFLLIVTGLALLIFIIKKLEVKKNLDKLREKFDFVGLMFKGFINFFGGFVDMFKAAFAGEGGALGEGLLRMLKGLLQILVGLLMTSFGLILAMIMGAFKLLANGVISVVNKIPGVNIKKMALGGVSNGGLTLVGERGPELVRLPSGARVHSNAESRRMGGGTINVHVNGRVGASDTEIRDIASKVAREINLQMNRQSHTVGRF
tara:strand:- start:1041 stop:2498 length:1458 start_codon:yes stop_codon:yes gene_type:complete